MKKLKITLSEKQALALGLGIGMIGGGAFCIFCPAIGKEAKFKILESVVEFGLHNMRILHGNDMIGCYAYSKDFAIEHAADLKKIADIIKGM